MTCKKCGEAALIVADLPRSLCPTCLHEYVAVLERSHAALIDASDAMKEQTSKLLDAVIAMEPPTLTLHAVVANARKVQP